MAFWVSTLPAFLAVPVLRKLIPSDSILGIWINEIPWFAPGLLAVLVVLFVRDVRRHRILSKRLGVRLEISFDPNCPSCVWETQPKMFWIRLHLRNPSIDTIDDVVMKLADIHPRHSLQLPCTLRFMHDQSAPGRPVTLHHSDDPQHVDFITFDGRVDQPRIQVNIAVPGGPATIPVGRYEGRVTAQGRNISEAAAQFTLEIGDDGKPRIQLVPFTGRS
jgi:hypothetical protein